MIIYFLNTKKNKINICTFIIYSLLIVKLSIFLNVLKKLKILINFLLFFDKFLIYSKKK